MSNDGFESVKGSGQTWEPKQTGSSKTNNLQKLQPGDDSWITGYYLGAQTGVGANNSIIHELKVDKVGSSEHLVGDEDVNGKVNVWGTGVLNNIIADKIQPGQLIKIVWLGVQKHKSGGKDYHGWDVLVNTNAEPLNLSAHAAATPAMDNDPNPEPEPQNNSAPATDTVTESAEDDDLPF